MTEQLLVEIEILKKELAEWEKKKEDGLIIELPIPLGATVYCISSKGTEVFSWDVTFAHIKWLKENFGTRAFDTKEKALARLKELRGEE